MRDADPYDYSSDEDEDDDYPDVPSGEDDDDDDDDDDDEAYNLRICPCWDTYRRTLERRGFLLDTCRDVKDYYEQHCSASDPDASLHSVPGYQRACIGKDNALCRDAGLPESLFRGRAVRDGARIVVKAVHLRSREFDIVKYITSPPHSKDPLNHCIPIRDLIEIPADSVGLIVMEEWSSELIPETPCSLGEYLDAIRQCIEHIVFLHARHIAHLDISLRNILTDYEHHYAFIDYENSRRFDARAGPPRVRHLKGTEIPPELERGEWCDPYKIDVWALAVLILRACKLTGYGIPELVHLVRPMLNDNPDYRPTARAVLQTFNTVVSHMSADRLAQFADDPHPHGPWRH
ncbi:hypothetical protein PUNSTDRAFT_71694 [Punctularia strigosozonata HHB-11173 SS5]|uniref:uncharacterized protein n=1 Tax=Punctularia strigosozonata (strain HHB-11173) TaxID=741275 RepID=UPI00044173C1|nr:uncharacterized protein PUNSTDRAFT_71694 [Punctularia strigosozonata HHB-11173 SS5]EIN07341.1 hypothetical protein PUNSTDRAFT_71694 [Punctularia strigosozonata HHB-11173 SS5]